MRKKKGRNCGIDGRMGVVSWPPIFFREGCLDGDQSIMDEGREIVAIIKKADENHLLEFLGNCAMRS